MRADKSVPLIQISNSLISSNMLWCVQLYLYSMCAHVICAWTYTHSLLLLTVLPMVLVYCMFVWIQHVVVVIVYWLALLKPSIKTIGLLLLKLRAKTGTMKVVIFYYLCYSLLTQNHLVELDSLNWVHKDLYKHEEDENLDIKSSLLSLLPKINAIR